MRWQSSYLLVIISCLQIFACKTSNDPANASHEVEPLANAEVGDVEHVTAGQHNHSTEAEEPPLPSQTSEENHSNQDSTLTESLDPTAPSITTNDTHTGENNDSHIDPTSEPDPESGTGSSNNTTTTTGPSEDNSVQQLCVDTINNYRASIGLPPYARWKEAEPCADSQAKLDSESDQPHSSFDLCDEHAQNECPRWLSPTFEYVTTKCLANMWAEGPGDDFLKHGHYINMSKITYTKVACGYYKTPDGRIWAVQDFQ